MALSTQAISDRIEIHDLLTRYCKSIDQKNWELLDTCFTPDAHVDYVSSGGIAGSYPEAREWLSKALAIFPVTLHSISNSEVVLDGDRATARTMVNNPMGFQNPDGSMHIFTVWAWYEDKLVRTPDGWRIEERIEKQELLEGEFPKALQIPE
jgi:hypothetical protein